MHFHFTVYTVKKYQNFTKILKLNLTDKEFGYYTVYKWKRFQ